MSTDTSTTSSSRPPWHINLAVEGTGYSPVGLVWVLDKARQRHAAIRLSPGSGEVSPLPWAVPSAGTTAQGFGLIAAGGLLRSRRSGNFVVGRSGGKLTEWVFGTQGRGNAALRHRDHPGARPAPPITTPELVATISSGQFPAARDAVRSLRPRHARVAPPR